MNIKINIKDCDCSPAVITRKEISEVQFKKKNMLYAAPTKDKKQTTSQTTKKNNNTMLANTQNTHIHYSNNKNFQEAETKLVHDLSQISKNQITMDMAHNSNTILQKQNEIIQSNQRTLLNMVANSRNTGSEHQNQQKNKELKRVFEESADKIARQVKDIKKMRDQILEAGEQFKKNLTEGKSTNSGKGTQHIGQMNTNLKNLVEVSKNHIQGLQNLEGIKSLQNFNIQAYTQAINTLKKQIVQYQKESQNIERQLKLRSAKLQKLQISPNFDEQLLQPYEQYLKKKADSVDLHSIKDKVYQKLGVFDYGKFQIDISTVTNEIRNQMNDFQIVCKQYRINIPDIKIDKKQLKQLDLKLPSILDQFKSSKGISFNQPRGQDEKVNIDTKKSSQPLRNTGKQFSKQQTKNAKKSNYAHQGQQLGVIYTKPTDYSTNVKLTRTDQQDYKSVLETKQQRQKKQVLKKVQKKDNPDDEFQKYLENRAKQQLAAIYEEKRKKLQQMEKQLYDTCKQQSKYELTLDVKNKISPKKQKIQEKQFEEESYNQDFEEDRSIRPVRKQERHKRLQQKLQISKQRQEIKAVGTQVLRQKLKNLFSKSSSLNQNAHQNRFVNPNSNVFQNGISQNNQMNSIAEGFINMINNTLTQVNTQLSQSIQKKIQNRSISKERKSDFEKKSPNSISIPRLEQFRAPPVFNMQMVQQPAFRSEQKRNEKKIVAKNYDHLRIKEQNDSDLEVSAMSFDD